MTTDQWYDDRGQIMTTYEVAIEPHRCVLYLTNINIAPAHGHN